jgi:hypothetical protein
MTIEFNHPVWDEGEVWEEESWTFHTGSHAGQYLPMDVDICVFHDGVHIYEGYACPHNQPEDITPGWTVQQQRTVDGY